MCSSDLNLQFNKANEFVAAPDWYFNFEYMKELTRGHESHEDLFVPGFFELPIKKGESIIFSASTSEQITSSLTRKFNAEIQRRPKKDCFESCLTNAAHQFIIKRGRKTEIIAGYPFFGRRGRDTFIALPGLTLSLGDVKICKDALDTISKELKDGLFPNSGSATTINYNSADTSLWFFWSLQMYAKHTNGNADVWKSFGKKIKDILTAYRDGTLPIEVKMHENGLIWTGGRGVALSWMDSSVNNLPITPRNGYQVEVNALWYNAIMFAIELAKENNDIKFAKEWEPLASKVAESFVNTFWFDKKQYLADFVDEQGQNVFVRPNQIFAASLPYSPITDDMKQGVIEVINNELLTPKGLRSLAPKNPNYASRYEGSHSVRDYAYHQGTTWPWLLGHYVEACYKLYGKGANPIAKEIIDSFGEDMSIHGICSISEVYDGDPPQRPRGCVSFALSVAEIIRIKRMYEQNQ